jgi:hypothetical protein
MIFDYKRRPLCVVLSCLCSLYTRLKPLSPLKNLYLTYSNMPGPRQITEIIPPLPQLDPDQIARLRCLNKWKSLDRGYKSILENGYHSHKYIYWKNLLEVDQKIVADHLTAANSPTKGAIRRNLKRVDEHKPIVEALENLAKDFDECLYELAECRREMLEDKKITIVNPQSNQDESANILRRVPCTICTEHEQEYCTKCDLLGNRLSEYRTRISHMYKIPSASTPSGSRSSSRRRMEGSKPNSRSSSQASTLRN